jgi:predicted AlkP superfamily pyrophosphatase or phosphodiesterase
MFHFFRGAMIALVLLTVSATAQHADAQRVLLIVLDGCRPDYVTPDVMPNVHALGQRGVVCTNHHAVYPTVTRVNSTSFATGCYPAKHGLMGNAVYFPSVDPDKGFSTGSAENLMRIAEAIDERLVTRPSIGEVMDQHGKKYLAVSSGSSGSAFLLNHMVRGGGLINVDLVLPKSLRATVDDVLGPVPDEAYPNVPRNHWVVDAYLKLALEEIQPDVTYMWLSDPDHTGHAKGIGDPVTVEALSAVDNEIGRIIATLDEKGLSETTNIIVTSDHGFSTQTAEAQLVPFLVQEKLKASLSSTDVIVVDGGIYVDGRDDSRIEAIVNALQQTPWAGALFIKAKEPGSDDGIVPGTLSLEMARFDHERAPDILVDAAWSDAENERGWKGTTALPGTAGHGTSSPFDIHNTLIASGPAFKKGVVNDLPTGNVDMMPTICTLVGVPVPEGVDGRVLIEILRDTEGTPPKVETSVHKSSVTTDGYSTEAHVSHVGESRYLDYTQTTRGAAHETEAGG